MFDFFDELFDGLSKKSYRYQVDSGKKIVIEGYKSILKVDENICIVKLAKGELEVVGSNLKIDEFGTNTLVLSGTIKSVSQVNKKKKK